MSNYLGCLWVRYSYIKMEDIHISPLVRLKKETLLSQQGDKLCMCKVKEN